jgi:alpha-beta hydrolase superfamily lysophospholipase
MAGSTRRWLGTCGIALALGGWGATIQLPGIGAGALLHPARRHVQSPPPAGCEEAEFTADSIVLRGWRCRGAAPRRGTIVYLHGSADNRTSAVGVVRLLVPRGFDVVAYDSRAHGESSGEACTYGFFEKQDLRRVVDTLPEGPIVVIGTSLGAAVSLQAAADDRRISAIVAAETFSDLRTVATERAPFFFTRRAIGLALTLAEREAHFEVDAVSPLEAAARIRVPVLLIHGGADMDTPPDHSRRVYDALGGPKCLVIVPGAPHNGSLSGETWAAIVRWIDALGLTAPR